MFHAMSVGFQDGATTTRGVTCLGEVTREKSASDAPDKVATLTNSWCSNNGRARRWSIAIEVYPPTIWIRSPQNSHPTLQVRLKQAYGMFMIYNPGPGMVMHSDLPSQIQKQRGPSLGQGTWALMHFRTLQCIYFLCNCYSFYACYLSLGVVLC